ncbi:MAG: ABC transporter ATP-binding protein [Bacilli bacterium]|nr:ABC transporter ATP-binding protein [Bacilli bacterium]
MEGKNRTKGNIISNFFFALKKIYKIDKIFILSGFLKTIISSVSVFIYPYILKVAIEGIELQREFKEVIIEVIITISIAFLLNTITSLIEHDYWFRSDKISMIFQKEFSLASMDLDFELLERSESQDAMEKAKRSLNPYGGMISTVMTGFDILGSFVSLGIACGIILSVNGWLIVIIVLFAVIKFFLESYNQRRRKLDFYDKIPNLWRKINYANGVSRNLNFGKDLRIYEMNKFANKERNIAIKEYNTLNKKNSIRDTFIKSILNLIRVFDELFLYAFMIYEVLFNNMMIATFTFMVAAVRQLIYSINNVISSYGYILEYSLKVNDYRKFMDIDFARPQEKEEFGNSLEKIEVEIEFKNVSYSYYMQEGYALKDISFKIKKGEKIALVGYNGAGKTTLIKLICGLYHPTSGEILINGMNIENVKRKSLQKLIAPVFQDTINYAIEITENVSMKYSKNSDNDRVIDVLKLVDLDKKIASLPLQEKTIITREIDDTGIELSGGENQKLSFARAIYKNAGLMILDEPTSALDALSEYNLYNNFNEMINNSTTIFISHRLSSTKFCDRILFLSEGRIIEEGTHQELMKFDGEYKKLFSMQAEYYKDGDTNEA